MHQQLNSHSNTTIARNRISSRKVLHIRLKNSRILLNQVFRLCFLSLLLIPTLLCGILFFEDLPTPVLAQPIDSEISIVSVSVPIDPVEPGETFTINIDINPNSAIAGAQFDLIFDPSIVTVNNVQEGNLLVQNGANTFFNPGQIDNEAGTVKGVSTAIISPGQTVSTAASFATITMTATDTGNCPLTLSNVIVANIEGYPLSINMTNSEVQINVNEPPPQEYVIPPNTNDIVGHWDFNENSGSVASDNSANDNIGTLINGPQWTTGRSGSALSFDGNDDFIDCGNDQSLNITDKITIETWINPAVAGEGGLNAGPICKAEDGVDWSWQLRYNSPGDGNFMGFQFNSNPEDSTWVSVNQNLLPGKWHHIVGVFDGTNIICYLNGVETDRDQISAISGGNARLFIGQDGWGNVFDGIIDDVRIWNKALSPDDIQSLYNQAPPAEDILPPHSNDIVGHWDFNENSGSIAFDNSANDNIGTLINGPQWITGRSGSALSFDGNDDFIDCGNDQSLDITDEFTIETWISPAVAGEGGPNAGIISKAEEGVDWSWQLRYNALGDGKFMGFQFNAIPEGRTWVSVNQNLLPGEWYHIVGVFDGTNIICYLNGVETDRNQISAISNGNAKLFIGQDGWGNIFNGIIDDVRIWNTALSPEDIRSLYNQAPPVEDIPPLHSNDTVGYWDFNENSGLIVSDNSVNDNIGTLINGPRWITGRSGSALSFDGNDDFIDCGNDQSLDITDEITIETWINPAAAGEGGPNAGIISKAEEGVDWSWQLRYNAPGGGKFMGFQFNTIPEGRTWVSVNQNLLPGEWYHIVGVFDGTNIICYLNGIETDRNQISSISSGNAKLFIGQDGWGNIFNGIIDDVRIWNRALSPDDIQSLHNQP